MDDAKLERANTLNDTAGAIGSALLMLGGEPDDSDGSCVWGKCARFMSADVKRSIRAIAQAELERVLEEVRREFEGM